MFWYFDLEFYYKRAHESVDLTGTVYRINCDISPVAFLSLLLLMDIPTLLYILEQSSWMQCYCINANGPAENGTKFDNPLNATGLCKPETLTPMNSGQIP